MCDYFEKFGVIVVGEFFIEGYSFEYCFVVCNGKFVGLLIDEIN